MSEKQQPKEMPLDIPDAGEEINAKYYIDYSRELGEGTCSIVRKCINRETRQRYAVKSVSKAHHKQVEMMRNEIELLQKLNHPHVVSMVDVFEDSEDLHLVTEYCKGGEIFDEVERGTKPKVSSEKQTVLIVRQLLEAMAYLHKNNIVHRDLKVQNVLFTTKKKDEIKLIDFNIATKHDENEDSPLSLKCGSLYYVSPEVLGKEYGKSCDVWSLGVIVYVLLFGKYPFYGESRDITLMKIRCQDVIFPSFTKVSYEAQDFIRKALQKDPCKRATLEEMCQHEWIRGTVLDTSTETLKKKKKHPSTMKEAIKRIFINPKRSPDERTYSFSEQPSEEMTTAGL